MSAPLAIMRVLTEHRELDNMHRRAGRDARPNEVKKHADAHKYCPLGRCGTRPGPYKGGSAEEAKQTRTAKITTWRKAKAQRNRAYLEEKVYVNL